MHKKLDTGEVFYVGKGKNNRAYSNRGRNIYWRRLVAKHGYYVEYAAKHLSEDLAFELEMFLIQECKDTNITLVNMTNGGEGCSGYKHSEENKIKFSNIKRGNKFSLGRKLSEKSRLALLLANKGRKIAESTKLLMSNIMKEKSCKPIIVVDNDKYLEFKSRKEAEVYIGCSATHISRYIKKGYYKNFKLICP